MRKGEAQVLTAIIEFFGLLFLMPLSGSGADLTISNVITGNGNMTLNGAMGATFFSGNGSGLTNLDPSKLSSGTANINISGNAAAATSAVTATSLTGALAGDVTGTQGATTVQKIQGYGVSASQPASNQVLRYSGGSWGPSAVNLGTDVTGTLPIGSGGTGSGTKNFVDLSSSQTVGGAKTFSSPIASNVPTGTAPLQVASTTMVSNLNAEMVGGQRLSDLDTIYQKKYTKVAVVEPYGNGDYTNPATAMADSSNWCGIAIKTAPCLLKVMSGFYDMLTPLQTQPYIDIEGSGEKATCLSGTVDGWRNGVVLGYADSEIRFLTIENRGGSGHLYSQALVISDSRPKITNVTATASGATNNYGIVNYTYSTPTMTNVTAEAYGGTNNYGVYNEYSAPIMHNVTASAYGGTNNYGISSYNDSYPNMSNVTASAYGGTNNYGIANHNYAIPTMTNVTAEASGGTNSNYGVYNDNCPSSIIMSNVMVTALGGIDTYGVANYNNSTPVMSNVIVNVSGGSEYNYAIYNESSSAPTLANVTSRASGGIDSWGFFNANNSGSGRIDHSTLSGLRSIRNDAPVTVYVGSSRLEGQVLGNVKCAGVYDSNYNFYTSSCP